MSRQNPGFSTPCTFFGEHTLRIMCCLKWMEKKIHFVGLKILQFISPNRLRMHIQPSIFHKFQGACPRTPCLEWLRAFGTRVRAFGTRLSAKRSLLSTLAQKVHIFHLWPQCFFSELLPCIWQVWWMGGSLGFNGLDYWVAVFSTT